MVISQISIEVRGVFNVSHDKRKKNVLLIHLQTIINIENYEDGTIIYRGFSFVRLQHVVTTIHLLWGWLSHYFVILVPFHIYSLKQKSIPPHYKCYLVTSIKDVCFLPMQYVTSSVVSIGSSSSASWPNYLCLLSFFFLNWLVPLPVLLFKKVAVCFARGRLALQTPFL